MLHKENMSINIEQMKLSNPPELRLIKILEVQELLAILRPLIEHMASRAKPFIAHPLSPLSTQPVPSKRLRQHLKT